MVFYDSKHTITYDTHTDRMKVISQGSSCTHVLEARILTSHGHKHDVAVCPKGVMTCTCGTFTPDRICRHADFVRCRLLHMYDSFSPQIDIIGMHRVMSHLNHMDKKTHRGAQSPHKNASAAIIPYLTTISPMASVGTNTGSCDATLHIGA